MAVLTPCRVQARLEAAGHRLPNPPLPRGSYAPYSETKMVDGLLVCVSGQASRQDGVPLPGICLTDKDVPPACFAAEQAMLSGLAALRMACGGDLNRVRLVSALRGYIRSGPDFECHSAVLDGASRILETAFPGMSRPARTVVGVASLPGRCWVEVEMTAWVCGPKAGDRSG